MRKGQNPRYVAVAVAVAPVMVLVQSSLLFSSPTRRRFFLQRPLEQPVVTRVIPLPPPGICLGYSVHRVHRSRCLSICIEFCQLLMLHHRRVMYIVYIRKENVGDLKSRIDLGSYAAVTSGPSLDGKNGSIR